MKNAHGFFDNGTAPASLSPSYGRTSSWPGFRSIEDPRNQLPAIIRNQHVLWTRPKAIRPLKNHGRLLLPKPAAQGYETNQLLNGIAAKADVTTDLYVTSDWSDGGATVAVI